MLIFLMILLQVTKISTFHDLNLLCQCSDTNFLLVDSFAVDQIINCNAFKISLNLQGHTLAINKKLFDMINESQIYNGTLIVTQQFASLASGCAFENLNIKSTSTFITDFTNSLLINSRIEFDGKVFLFKIENSILQSLIVNSSSSLSYSVISTNITECFINSTLDSIEFQFIVYAKSIQFVGISLSVRSRLLIQSVSQIGFFGELSTSTVSDIFLFGQIQQLESVQEVRHLVGLFAIYITHTTITSVIINTNAQLNPSDFGLFAATVYYSQLADVINIVNLTVVGADSSYRNSGGLMFNIIFDSVISTSQIIGTVSFLQSNFKYLGGVAAGGRVLTVFVCYFRVNFALYNSVEFSGALFGFLENSMLRDISIKLVAITDRNAGGVVALIIGDGMTVLKYLSLRLDFNSVKKPKNVGIICSVYQPTYEGKPKQNATLIISQIVGLVDVPLKSVSQVYGVDERKVIILNTFFNCKGKLYYTDFKNSLINENQLKQDNWFESFENGLFIPQLKSSFPISIENQMYLRFLLQEQYFDQDQKLGILVPKTEHKFCEEPFCFGRQITAASYECSEGYQTDNIFLCHQKIS